MKIDPITLSVIRNGLGMVASEMDLTQEKMSFSPIISEAMDRANGIYHRDSGEMIIQGARGLPLFTSVMQATVATVIGGSGQLDDGDVLIVNDPYLGGTHLMDVRVVRPVFRDGRIWAWVANSAHWADIGGSVAGGFSSSTTDIHQEGLRITPIRICRSGTIEQDTLRMILANCRVPEERVGDLKAQLGALSVGVRRLSALLDRYGDDLVEAAINELRTRSETEMRSVIADLPDGIYRAQVALDSDGINAEPLWVNLEMTISGTELRFDLSKSSPPCAGPINVPWATTQSAIHIAVRHMFPDIPMNAGCFAPISILRPADTFLDAKYPQPVAGAAAEGSQRVLEAALMALGQAKPDRACAGAFGTAGNLSIGGWDPEEGRHFVMYYFSGGGYGGNYAGDGHSNACPTIAFSATQPFEILEQHYPVLFEEAKLREDSGGAGRHRGGLGISYRLRLLRGVATASVLMDHGRFPPYALRGGKTGALTEVEFSQRGEIKRPEHISKGSGYSLVPGDWVQIRTPGGGGFGDPFERDPDLIIRDLLRGYIGVSAAERDYRFGEKAQAVCPMT